MLDRLAQLDPIHEKGPGEEHELNCRLDSQQAANKVVPLDVDRVVRTAYSVAEAPTIILTHTHGTHSTHGMHGTHGTHAHRHARDTDAHDSSLLRCCPCSVQAPQNMPYRLVNLVHTGPARTPAASGLAPTGVNHLRGSTRAYRTSLMKRKKSPGSASKL